MNIGTATRATDVLHLEASTKKIITRTWKDERDKHRMKEMLHRMAEYIEAINSLNPQPLSQLPTSFDPNSPVNQKTLEQIHKCRLITETVMEWLEQMRKSGAEYFVNLSKVHNGAIQVMKELETEISNWKNEEVEWATRASQMREVQTYGVMKFLVEKPVPGLDDSILYVCQKNIEWRNSLIKQAYEEFTKLADQLAKLTTSM